MGDWPSAPEVHLQKPRGQSKWSRLGGRGAGNSGACRRMHTCRHAAPCRFRCRSPKSESEFSALASGADRRIGAYGLQPGWSPYAPMYRSALEANAGQLRLGLRRSASKFAWRRMPANVQAAACVRVPSKGRSRPGTMGAPLSACRARQISMQSAEVRVGAICIDFGCGPAHLSMWGPACLDRTFTDVPVRIRSLCSKCRLGLRRSASKFAWRGMPGNVQGWLMLCAHTHPCLAFRSRCVCVCLHVGMVCACVSVPSWAQVALLVIPLAVVLLCFACLWHRWVGMGSALRGRHATLLGRSVSARRLR